ncbi:MAG: metallophosphoesterase family protein, partial [Candidatus Thorarchaeota archaeon]|nr:metallophosphoesterase family protein [Candidatus Thorarchaeota archaeon]
MSRKLSFLVLFSLLVLSSSGLVLTGLNNQMTSYEPKSRDVMADIAFTRGPTVNMVNKTNAMIFWRTETETNATVNYGNASDNLDSSKSESTLSKEHRIWIDNLNAGTTVYYEVVSNGVSSDVYHFKTEPEDGKPFKLVIMGDNRPDGSVAPEQPQTFKDIMDMVKNEEPHLVIMSGDYVYTLTDDHSKNVRAMEKFTEVTDKVGHYVPIYGAIGNHDTAPGEGYADYFLDAFEQYGDDSTYFSFDYAGAHFTILDTEIPGYEGRITGAQYEWLVDDLETTDKQIKFVI